MKHRIHWAKHIQYARALRKHQTPEEEIMWNCLRNRKLSGYKFLRQHVIILSHYIDTLPFYIIDFYCAEKRFVVKIDGLIHATQIDYDQARDLMMKEMNINVLRITNEEVNANLQGVLIRIKSALHLPMS